MFLHPEPCFARGENSKVQLHEIPPRVKEDDPRQSFAHFSPSLAGACLCGTTVLRTAKRRPVCASFAQANQPFHVWKHNETRTDSSVRVIHLLFTFSSLLEWEPTCISNDSYQSLLGQIPFVFLKKLWSMYRSQRGITRRQMPHRPQNRPEPLQ